MTVLIYIKELNSFVHDKQQFNNIRKIKHPLINLERKFGHFVSYVLKTLFKRGVHFTMIYISK